MALPTTGPITAALINAELGKAANAQCSLGAGDARKLAGMLSGKIAYSDFRGKSSGVMSYYLTVGHHKTNANDGLPIGYGHDPNKYVGGGIDGLVSSGQYTLHYNNSFGVWQSIVYGVRKDFEFDISVLIVDAGGTIFRVGVDIPYSSIVVNGELTIARDSILDRSASVYQAEALRLYNYLKPRLGARIKIDFI